jgi:tetratricopeptide (TPR) repeat protein
MKSALRIYTTWCAACFALALAGMTSAAGSSSGGGGLPPQETSQRALSPEEQSAKLFRAGVKHRDRALKHEAKAAAATQDRKKTKYLERARKEYDKAMAKQAEAVRLDPRNYKAANELGFALRKTGDFRKAIGAYNYALEINPNFNEAIEYRGEAFLALGFYDHSKDAYMTLFRNDRDLAQQLMAAFDQWAQQQTKTAGEAEDEFLTWIEERKRLAQITNDLSMNNLRRW